MRQIRFLLPPLFLLLAGPAGAADRGTTQRDEGFRGAVTAPLEDLNIKQADIPDVLLRAVVDPYDVKELTRCEAIAAEIGKLDAALGPDLDEPPPPDNRTRTQKVAAQAKAAAVAGVRGESQDVLPFRGWVRKLTGAEHHRKQVEAAVKAGSVRRGYLKGVGMHMNCAPPAAPSWFVPEEPPAPKTWMGGIWERIVTWFKGLLAVFGR
jgi:hypothetical protein